MGPQKLDIDQGEFDLPKLPALDGRDCLLQWCDSLWIRPNLGPAPGLTLSLLLDCAPPGLPIGLCAPIPLETAEAYLQQLQRLISAGPGDPRSWLDRWKREARR